MENPTRLADALLNSIVLDNDRVVLAFGYGFVILDEALNHLKSICFDEIDPCVNLILHVVDNLTNDSFYMSLWTEDSKKFKHTYTGTGEPKYNSWILKTSFISEDLKFELKDPDENSLLLKNEYVVSVYEF